MGSDRAFVRARFACAAPQASAVPAIIILLVLAPPVLATHRTLVNNGPNANRVNIIFLGDGYTSSEISTTYSSHVMAMYRELFQSGEEPFARYRRFFNAHAIDVVSNQSGADVPPQGIFRDTALDARYYFDGTTERLLYISDAKANSIVTTALSHADFTPDMRIISINDTRYGGGGGFYATYAGGNSSATEIALHELGHSFSGLADEYGGFTTPYVGAEPPEVNVTKDPAGAKWSRWLGYNQPGIGTIGAYNGARYYNSGIYRPSNNSKMRSLGQPFDAISREKIILDIYNIIDPLDAHLPSAGTLVDPPSLWVTPIDSSLISVEWRVNGVVVTDAFDDESFNLAEYNFLPGAYSVTARAYDATGFDPVNGWVRKDQHLLQQLVTWNVLHTVPEPGATVLVIATLICLRCHRGRAPSP